MIPRMGPARSFEDHSVPHQFRPFARDLVARAAPQPGDRVLDVACGTGVVARLVAPLVAPGGSVVGLDLDPAMLAVARDCADAEGIAVTWHGANAVALPFEDGSFDLVLCQQGLQFMPERSAAVREMRRGLIPDGRVLVAAWAPIAENPVRAAIDRAARERLGFSSIAGRFGLGDAATLRGLVENAGFADVTIIAVDLTLQFPSYADFVRSAVEPDARQLPAEMQAQAIHDIQERARQQIGENIIGEAVDIPTRTYVASGRRST